MPTIHVVDDEPAVRKAVGRLLRAAGYDVSVYESAKQLIDQLPENQKSGCILLDMLMPGMSGDTAQERLKEIGLVLPIVFMTGSTERIVGGTEDFLKSQSRRKNCLMRSSAIRVRLPRRIVRPWHCLATPREIAEFRAALSCDTPLSATSLVTF